MNCCEWKASEKTRENQSELIVIFKFYCIETLFFQRMQAKEGQKCPN